MQIRKVVFSLITIGLCAGCGNVGFQAEKANLLATSAVLSSAGTSSTVIPDASPTPTPPNGPALGDLPQVSIPVNRICSYAMSLSATNFTVAISTNLPVSLNINGVVCSSDPVKLKALLRLNNITTADLYQVCPGSIPTSGDISLQLLINNNDLSQTGPGLLKSKTGRLSILWDTNPAIDQTGSVRPPGAVSSSSNVTPADPDCTQYASPLVIQLAPKEGVPSPINLSSIENGVMFDLLGARNHHQKVRIGWFQSPDYRMLVLPDENGNVNGIDQLFGNNTSGPDGEFADNGYGALAKYDGMSADGRVRLGPADARIDRNDPVFNRLRLWQDVNYDGVVQSSELSSLAENGIAFIDLDYSANFAEFDRYGNETRMKSVVGFNDGHLNLIFDLWFRY